MQSSVDASCETLSKELTEFRGYVVSRGFDIENILTDIITHLLALNRPPYENETEDEYLFYLSCRRFMRSDLLAGRDFGFGKKISVLRKILDWIPKKLTSGFTVPDFDVAVQWRNKFAHTHIVLSLDEDNRVVPTLDVKIEGKMTQVRLTTEKLKEICEAMEACYAASVEFEKRLCVRYGDARANKPHSGDEDGARPSEVVGGGQS